MFNDETILVTGGTGSFGQRFIEFLLTEYAPHKVIVFSRDELKQFEMRQRFAAHDAKIRYFIGDVRDERRLQRAFSGVDTVVHAAAMKQVPACEYNPIEAVKTNVMGATHIIDAAIDQGVKRVMALSTDKAANPVNLYGASKLCAEKLFSQANSYSPGQGCRFSSVRYGNVIGSRGSVVPLFLQQRDRGKITITDRRMTRFWITLDQAVQFVAHAIGDMKGGEVFVPKLPTMSIMDLAEAIAPGCEIEDISIRPGEKLHEVLLAEEEAHQAVEQEGRYVIHPAISFAGEDRKQLGIPLPPGFSFTSQNGPDQLDIAQLRAWVAELEAQELRIHRAA